MATPLSDQRKYSIDAIRLGIPNICPDEYVALQHDNISAKLDPCIIETVEILYRNFFFKGTETFNTAFKTFKKQDCSQYLLKKTEELKTNSERIASSVRDISDSDKEVYIFIAERIQDLAFVSKFVASQRLALENHTCLKSADRLECELKELRGKVLREAGDHHLSLARIGKIERELHDLKTAFERNQFELITQAAKVLDRDLFSL